MRYFEEKQVHSSCSTWSTSDVEVVREIGKAEFLAHPDENKLVSKRRGFSIAHAPADETFYHRGFSFRVSDAEMKTRVAAKYLSCGWTIIKDHAFLEEAISLYCEDERIARKTRRAKQGYVIPEWTREMLPIEYQGGFSAEVFNHPELFDYVKSGGCHGFIGHEVRKPKLDAYLEAQFLNLNPDKSLFAMWLTSTGGRHFGDELEGATFSKQQIIIRNRIAGIVEQANHYRQKEAA